MGAERIQAPVATVNPRVGHVLPATFEQEPEVAADRETYPCTGTEDKFKTSTDKPLGVVPIYIVGQPPSGHLEIRYDAGLWLDKIVAAQHVAATSQLPGPSVVPAATAPSRISKLPR